MDAANDHESKASQSGLPRAGSALLFTVLAWGSALATIVLASTLSLFGTEGSPTGIILVFPVVLSAVVFWVVGLLRGCAALRASKNAVAGTRPRRAAWAAVLLALFLPIVAATGWYLNSAIKDRQGEQDLARQKGRAKRALLQQEQPDEPTALEDRPLGSKIHFSALHYAEGKEHSREFVVRGTLDGPGLLELNPNHLMLDSKGRIQGSTSMGYDPIKVHIKLVDTPDPDKKGRKVYDIVPDKGGRMRKFALVLSPNEAGPHHLLIQEGDTFVGTYPLVDPGRQEHQEMGPKLAQASAEEQKAIAELRKSVGYSFRFRLESKNAVTFLHFPQADDICKLDSSLHGLKNLSHLSFQGGRLRREGLESIRQMPSLKALDFIFSDIDDEGLACVQDSTQLASMSFFGSRGISDKDMAYFQGLKNLKLLDLRNESFTATEPRLPRITDAGLKHLAGLTKLEYLNLQGQQITDEGLKHLHGMSNLQSLALSFSGITDEGLKHLEGHQQLRSLHLYGTRVTAEGRAGLNAKLPMLDQ